MRLVLTDCRNMSYATMAMPHHPDHYRSISRKTWERHHGPIPPGYEIHHKDFDDTNFDIDNLECLTALEHRQRHIAGAPKRKGICRHCGGPWFNPWPYKPRLYCSNACKSAARYASGIDNVERVCETCGRTYAVNRYKKVSHYCSLACTPRGSYERTPQHRALMSQRQLDRSRRK